MRKQFLVWFKQYGLMGDRVQDTAQLAMVERVCWRAYRRGFKDGQDADTMIFAPLTQGIQMGGNT